MIKISKSKHIKMILITSWQISKFCWHFAIGGMIGPELPVIQTKWKEINEDQ